MLRLVTTVIALLLVTVAGAIGYLASRDPNTFKPELEALIRDHTGLDADLGSLDWRLWPPLAIEARGISAAYPDAARLVAADRLALDVRILPLFSLDPRLEIRGVQLRGITATLVRDQNGRSNWQPREAPAGAAPKSTPPASEGPPPAGLLLPLAIGPLHLDGQVEFEDAATGQRWQIDEWVLEAGHAQLGAAVPISVSFRGSRGDGANLRVSATTRLTLPETLQGRVTAADVDITGSVQRKSGQAALPVTLHAGEIGYDLAAKRLEIPEFASGAGDERITGKVTAELGVRRDLQFGLAADSLNLDPYLTDSDQPAGAAAPAAAVGLLPTDTLEALRWNGTLDIGELQLSGYTLENLHLTTDGDGSQARSELEAGWLSGTVTAALTATLRAPPEWRLDLTLKGVQGKALVDRLAPGWQFEGTLQLDAQLRASGNDSEAIAASVSGPVRFDGGQGRLDVRGLKAQAAALATLAGRGQAVAKWPDVLDYTRLTGALELDGLDALTFSGALDNLVIEGHGGYDLAANRVDLQANLTVQDDPRYHSFDVNEFLVGIPLPVRCRGALDGAARLCTLNAKRAQDVIAQALRGKGGDEVRQRLERTIDEKVPEQFRDAAKTFLDLLGRSQGGDNPSNTKTR